MTLRKAFVSGNESNALLPMTTGKKDLKLRLAVVSIRSPR